MSLRVTVVDEQTGDTDTAQITDGDYILICADPCYRKGVVVTGDGATHTITVAGRTTLKPCSMCGLVTAVPHRWLVDERICVVQDPPHSGEHRG